MNPIWIAIIAAIPPTIAAVAALIVSLQNKTKIQDVHISLNSRLSELVKASKAVGAQEERDSHSITVEGVPKEPETPRD